MHQRPIGRRGRVGAGPWSGHLYTTIRHARIPAKRASQFWKRVEGADPEISQLPRSGDTIYGFAAAHTRLTTRPCPRWTMTLPKLTTTLPNGTTLSSASLPGVPAPTLPSDDRT